MKILKIIKKKVYGNGIITPPVIEEGNFANINQKVYGKYILIIIS